MLTKQISAYATPQSPPLTISSVWAITCTNNNANILISEIEKGEN